MKKTLTVNLNNTVYHIDEDAYESLQEYLNSLRNHFAEEEGADEILSDIEARIAELFKERLRFRNANYNTSRSKRNHYHYGTSWKILTDI